MENKKEEPRMKKLVALLLAAMMLLTSVAALAEAPEGYPAVIEGLDLGGRTITIKSWYDTVRAEEPDEEQAARYAYEDWLMETYNFKLVYEVPYDWAGSQQYLNDFVVNEENAKDLTLIQMPGDFIATAYKNNLVAPWNDLIDLTNEKWNDAALEFMTKNGQVLGVFSGYAEPREAVFFNHTLLKDAGIDPDSLYQMQADGTWTWDALLDLCEKVQKDVDGDGVIDIWATTGTDPLFFGAFANNNASYFAIEDGKLVNTLGTENALEALTFVRNVRDNYFFKGDPDENGSVSWDYYKSAFASGRAVFSFIDTWEGYNGNEVLNDADFTWGAVMFPIGPHGTPGEYKSTVSYNVMTIPNIYEEADAKAIATVYDLWTEPTPGYEDDEESWIGQKYNAGCDDKAVDETYAMMVEAEHTHIDYYTFLGDKNSILGPDIFWQLDWNDPSALVEAVSPRWDAKAEDFNK